jgi:hypothetical protein
MQPALVILASLTLVNPVPRAEVDEDLLTLACSPTPTLAHCIYFTPTITGCQCSRGGSGLNGTTCCFPYGVGGELDP